MHDFRQQTLALSTGWGYTARALQRQGISVRTVIPREGATGWVDSWMLHSQAAHPVRLSVDGLCPAPACAGHGG